MSGKINRGIVSACRLLELFFFFTKATTDNVIFVYHGKTLPKADSAIVKKWFDDETNAD